jgi:hypothetical protein
MFQTVQPLTLWSSLQSFAFRLWDEEEKKLVSYGYIETVLSKRPTSCGE